MATWDCTPNGVFTTTSFTPAIRTALNTQPWSVPISAPASISTYSGYNCLVGNGNGGLWIVNGQIALFRDEDAAEIVNSGTVTGTNGTIAVDAGARTLTLSGFTTGNGTYTWLVGASGTIFASGDVGVGIYSDGSSYDWNGTVGDVTYTDSSPVGNAAIALSALTASSAGSIDISGAGAIALGALTVLGEDTPYGSAAITLGPLASSSTGTIELQGTGAITLGAATTSATASGPATWSVGASTVQQWMNADGPADVTVTTGTPISTTTGSILVAMLARGNWDAAPGAKGPTDSQGNTWIAVTGPTAYAAYPSSKAAMYYCVNNAGSTSHTFSMSRGQYNGGSTGDEVTLAVVELKGPVMLDSTAQVERAIGSATVTSAPVTPTGPSIIFCNVFGNGPVLQTHAFTATAGSAAAGWTNVAGASANGDPNPNGYIQNSPWVLINESGSLAGQATTLSVNGTSNEGGQFHAAVFQLAAGVLGVGSPQLGALTAAGEGVTPVLGDAAVALSALGASATGEIDVSGAAAVVLGAVAVAATSAVDVSGAGAAQLGVLTAAAGASIELVGEAAVVLGTLAAAGAGSIELLGESAIALGALVASGATADIVSGEAAIGLGTLVANGDGTITTATAGDAALTLGALAASGEGFSGAVAGDATIVLGALTSSTPAPAARRIHAVFIDGIHARWIRTDELAAVFIDEEDNVTNDEKRVNQNETPKTIRARAFTSEAYVDLTQWTGLQFKMTGPATVEGAAAGDAAGYASYTFTGAQLAVPGTYEAWFSGVDENGQPRSIPEQTRLRIVVAS